MNKLKQLLSVAFKLKDLGKLKYFIGLEIARSSQGILINQRKFVLDMLKEYGQLGAKPTSVPIEVNHKLKHNDDTLLEDATFYRQLVGKLLYLTLTRPDVCYAFHVLTQLMDILSKGHLDATFRVLKYLKNAPGKGILLSAKSELEL